MPLTKNNQKLDFIWTIENRSRYFVVNYYYFKNSIHMYVLNDNEQFEKLEKLLSNKILEYDELLWWIIVIIIVVVLCHCKYTYFYQCYIQNRDYDVPFCLLNINMEITQ